MISQVKSDIPEEVRKARRADSGFELQDMVNASELEPFIKEADAALKPCAHCESKAEIVYRFTPMDRKFQEHWVHVACSECGIRTMPVTADDNEVDLKDALQRVSSWWNRRSE